MNKGYLMNTIDNKILDIVRKKYPRTYHFPWSLGVQSDDKIIKDLSHFYGRIIVVTEKLDGENTTLYPDYYHARSIDSKFNFTRAWVAKMHACLKFNIPQKMKLVGENMWGKHSIHYKNGVLDGYFYLFSIWEELNDGSDFCVDYDTLVEYAELLELPMPKVLYRGEYCEKTLQELSKNMDTNLCEGYVVRTVEGFHRKDVNTHIAKWVREGHVQPNSDHWLKNAERNGELSENVLPPFMK
jgi:hypothetical protein